MRRKFDMPKEYKSHQLFRHWENMFNRVYAGRFDKVYRHVYIQDSWYRFSEFYYDNIDQVGWDKEGFSFDKDLLTDCKAYTNKTTCFIPRELNLKIPKEYQDIPRKYPVGVKCVGGMYVGYLVIDSQRKESSQFKTVDRAFDWVRYQKLQYCCEIADRFADVISEQAYLALKSYDFTQTRLIKPMADESVYELFKESKKHKDTKNQYYYDTGFDW